MNKENLLTPESNLEKTAKQVLWEKQITFLNEIRETKDEQPIDENIKETLAALNVSGILTIASCGGHALQERHTGDTPYPWILISSKNLKGENLSYDRLQSLLAEFYNNRQTENDIRLEVSDSNYDQISLSNAINEDLSDRLAEGKLTEEEKQDFIAKLPRRQREMEDFGQFLKARFFAGS